MEAQSDREEERGGQSTENMRDINASEECVWRR